MEKLACYFVLFFSCTV